MTGSAMRLTRSGQVFAVFLVVLVVVAVVLATPWPAVAAAVILVTVLAPHRAIAPRMARRPLVDHEHPAVGAPPRFDGPGVGHSPELEAEAWRRERARRSRDG